MIVAVKKAKIFILENEKTDLLLALQKSELFMLSKSATEKQVDVKYEEELIQRATTIVNKLANYHPKPGFLDYHTVEYDEFVKEDIKRVDLLEHFEKDFELLEQLKNNNQEISKLVESITPFNNLPYTTSDLTKSRYVSFHLGYVGEEDLEGLEKHFNANNIEFERYELSNYGYPLIFVLDKDDESIELDKIKTFNYIPTTLPITHLKMSKYIENLNKELTDNENKITELETSFKESLNLSKELKLLIDQTNARKTRLQINFEETKSTIYVEGWVREDQIEKLNDVVRSVTEEFAIDISEPGSDETPPTATKNNKFVHQFETITNMFSVPNHQEVDPNPIMSVWYWLIFGIMMGDMGYGLMMVLLLGLFIKFKKPKGSFSQLVHVLYYSGYTSIVAGFIFGSFFGASVDVIAFITGGKLQSFSMMDNILNMLFFSVGLGVLHLSSGLALKVKLALKHKDPLTALADGVSWIAILIGGSIATLGLAVLNSNAILYIGLALVAIGLLLIITLAGREKKGFFGKVTSSLGGLYGVADYLSDLLSYSRILALALSSSVIAFTMNTLAGLVQGSFIGIIFSIVIYIIGHVFNFAMGLLSAYVHDSRLQYIEFFGKFYEGGGYEFKPLSFDTKHIKEITN